MTKQQYLDMCDMLGSEPIEAEIPVEFDDLPLEVQEAYQIYDVLPDNYEGMSGSYLGKNYAGIQEIMSIFGIEDSLTTLKLIRLIDANRKEFISTKNANKTPPAK